MERSFSIPFEGVDSDTPLNEKLSAKYTKSFAYYTVKDRMPIILTRVINDLVTNKKKILQEYQKEAEEDLKLAIGQISKLKNELVTNKPLIKLNSQGEDVKEWNDFLDSQSNSEKDAPCWYYSPWLYVECYMYRRLWEVFENSQHFQNLDPFAIKKEDAFNNALSEIKTLAKACHFILKQFETSVENLQDKFVEFLKLSLWSNKCDLSLSSEEQILEDCSSLSKINTLNLFLLSDDSLKVFEYLKQNPYGVVDFVTDNSSYEIFSDFCFCDFLCVSKLASKIKFHVKKFPWYVSDTTRNDIKWLLERMEKEGMENLSMRWKKYFEENVWSILDEKYWTLPFDFNEMKTKDPNLYNSLAQSNLVILKGDLNYRKLLCDINWNHSEKFQVVLRDFQPTSILSLRTVKSDLICGLLPGKSEEISKKDKMWMRTGEYASVQFCNA